MAVLAALALGIGLIASFRLPLLVFAVLLLGATAIGSGLGFLLLPRPSDVAIGALLLFAAAQVGYGLGFAVAALSNGGRKGSA